MSRLEAVMLTGLTGLLGFVVFMFVVAAAFRLYEGAFGLGLVYAILGFAVTLLALIWGQAAVDEWHWMALP